MSERIKVAFASGSEDLIPTLLERLAEIEPDLPVYVISEFAPPAGHWVPYKVGHGFRENLARVRAELAGKRVAYAALILQPRMPYWKMRFIPVTLWPLRTLFYNENLDHFMLRPWSLPKIAGHFWWRLKNLARWELRPGGATYTFLWRLAHPRAFVRPLAYGAGLLAGRLAALRLAMLPRRTDRPLSPELPEGVSVVIPSRDGKDLLARLLPSVLSQLPESGEVIVVDNGSKDGTAGSLAREFPRVQVDVSAEPLSFAAAVNRGIGRARYSRVCLLNNDMVVEPRFFAALLDAFQREPDLFAATAQIFLPEGRRREETGKAVMPPLACRNPDDFPVRCDVPAEREDGSYVLYGSGGCTLYDTSKLRALGGMNEVYAPAYVEDLDLGYRAWVRGWPAVYVAGARVLHYHRQTTSRYYRREELDWALERNYLRFVASAAASPAVFLRLWREALKRLNLLASRMEPVPPAMRALSRSWRAPMWVSPPPAGARDEEEFLALASGAVSLFPGREPRGKPAVLIATPYLPFPLSHGGAVRMYNLMRCAAEDFDLVLVSLVERAQPAPPELLAICVEVTTVRRIGGHIFPLSGRPEVVEEFASPAFAAALRKRVSKWRPGVAQLEFTQLAQYAAHCRPARTVLVEHDITLDLYAQLLRERPSYDLRQQHERWVRFETEAWRSVDAVVTMSEKDRRAVTAGRAIVIPNGVDLERFQAAAEEPERARLLFIGSFAHLPNVMAVDFFLREVWPALSDLQPVLHIVAGADHQRFLPSSLNLQRPGLEVEDFVSDVRPAYRRATVVIAPLVASAGTNIKIMEAMAMGKAIVSTPAGINGLDLQPGRDLVVTSTGEEMARAIRELLENPARRRSFESQARRTAEQKYDWRQIARLQRQLWDRLSLLPDSEPEPPGSEYSYRRAPKTA